MSPFLLLLRRAAAPALLAAPAALAAQGTPGKTDTAGVTELAPIEVTATRSEAVAPPVTTIQVGAAQLQRAPATDPYDLVRRASGIEVHQQGQGPGFASDAVIRGFTSDHSSDVLLVIDGVRSTCRCTGTPRPRRLSVLSPGTSTIRVIHGRRAALPATSPSRSRRSLPRRRPHGGARSSWRRGRWVRPATARRRRLPGRARGPRSRGGATTRLLANGPARVAQSGAARSRAARRWPS
jgi:hypothetical protein